MSHYLKKSRLSTLEPLLCDVKNLGITVVSDGKELALTKDVSFQLRTNEVLGIVGESGSGKSITCKTIMGLLPISLKVDADKFEVLGKEVLSFGDREWSRFRGSETSMIFQEPMSSLNPTKICGQQVSEILKIHTNLSSRDRKKQVVELFERVKLPVAKSTYNKYPHEISGGQMQRVMIAMAIACKPKILIADEPTTALDVTVQQEIIELLKELQQEYGMSIIFISHDLTLVQSFADRIIVMYKGKIEETGSADAIFYHPKSKYTQALIASRPNVEERLKVLPTVSDYVNEGFKPELITAAQREKSHQEIYVQKPLLQVINLIKDFPLKKKLFVKQKIFRAVDGVSFDLFSKESLGLVGESGCGKSTVGNLILGLKSITSGKIIFQDKDLSSLTNSEMQEMRKHLQIIFQDPFASLNPRLTVADCIMEAMKWHGIGSGNMDRREKTVDLLRRVGLSEKDLFKYPHEFSGGQRQRIGIARTIALEPRLIVCDESVSALDISVQAQVLNLLNELKDIYNFSYLFISHDLAVVKYFCDRVIVMNKGKIEEINEADELYRNPKSEYTKSLIASLCNI
ncbi:MAG: ABC transporter ATP-binding protein [Nonlabens sp.]